MHVIKYSLHPARFMFTGRYEMPAEHVGIVASVLREASSRGSTREREGDPTKVVHCAHQAALSIRTCHRECEFGRWTNSCFDISLINKLFN